MLDGKKVGYWYPTYKDGDKTWLELKFILHDAIKSKNEQLKKMELITGGSLDMWSMDEPDSGRGFAYHRAIIDEGEKAKKLKDSWEQVIRATLLYHKGDAWFLSTPKFGKTYFKDVLFKNELSMPLTWKSWRFTSFDNPYLDPREIEEARKLDELTFKCEYLAEDVDLTYHPFAYAFDVKKHVRECTYVPGYEVMLSFDFNVDPITALMAQHIDSEIRFFKEFRLSNSNIYELCDQIRAFLPNALYLVTGDATGHGRSALAAGNINYYTVIQQKLNLADGQMRQPGVNPSVADTRVLMNSILQNYKVSVDPSLQYLIEDLKYVEVNDEGDIDKKKDKHRSHLLDNGRYLLNTFFGYFVNIG
jgi:hypothetical protein